MIFGSWQKTGFGRNVSRGLSGACARIGHPDHRQLQCIGLAARSLAALACRSPQIVRTKLSSSVLALIIMPWIYPRSGMGMVTANVIDGLSMGKATSFDGMLDKHESRLVSLS
jgi:hypothetical protein